VAHSPRTSFIRASVGAAVLGSALPAIAGEERIPTLEVPRMAAPASDANAAIQTQMNEMRIMIERQNHVIEQLQKKLDNKDAPLTRPIIVPTAGTTAAADRADPITSEVLDARIASAIASYQTKSDAAPASNTFEVGKNLDLKTSWQHGLVAESADKAFRVHVGGRTQLDVVGFDGDDDVQFGSGGTGQFMDGVNFRRARLAIEGTFFEVIDFNCEYDFLNTVSTPAPGANTPAPTDLYLQITHLPVVGNLRIGNQKPSISFEHLTSSRFLNFIERSYTFDAFIGGLDNGFRPGAQFFNTAFDERMTWAIGLFKNHNRGPGWNTGDGEGDVTGRLTFLPWYSNDGRCLLHVGVGASHRDLDDGEVRFRSRTLLRNGPAHLHTVLGEARMTGDDQNLLVPEVVFVHGPLTVQAEYFATWVSDVTSRITPGPTTAVDAGTYSSDGWYVEVLYFLTGENRVYDTKYPRFTRVVPNENYFFVDGDCGKIFGRGAWQVGARYSTIDLNDSGINGGELDDVTLGLNWFLNPNLKFQWNYTYSWRDAAGDTSDGNVHGLGMRVAFDF